MLTVRQAERLRDVNPLEALPRGAHHGPRRQPPEVRMADAEGTAFLRDRELFRMRTRPELYDDWMREVVEDARVKVAEDAGMYDWDCHRCHASVLTYSLSDACPRCGS